ncbi:MAG TPA: hypothetical protein VJQ82_21745 [Terriglobales bacterium]|nr:hypothetical protein [Terriglobales bacterium]
MRAATNRLTGILVIGFIALVGTLACSQDSSSQIRARTAALEQSLKDHPIPDKDYAGIASTAADMLKAADDALDRGQLYLALEKLGQGEDLLKGAQRGADKSDIEKDGMPAFDAKWNHASLLLTALDKESQNRAWNAPLAIRALAEAAQGKATPLLEGGRGFATANGPADGLLYVGEAEGLADFSTFCASLRQPAKPHSPLRSLLPELQALQRETNAAFEPPKSIDLHSRFIALNGTLKLAHELDASRAYAGAMYAYLDAVRHYGMLDAPPLSAADQEKVKKDLAAAVKNLAKSADDVSIAQLFLERAQSYASHSDGSAPTADEWRGARVILDQVLPAYFAAQKPASALAQAPGKTVEITLVRWPYT